MSKPPSNTRRFINAAWSLLTFQLIAAVGAVAVTGYAFLQQSNAPDRYAGEVPAATVDAVEAEPTPPPDVAEPAPPAPGDTVADAAPTIPLEAAPQTPQFFDPPPVCATEGHYTVVRMGQWCNTRIDLRQGQRVDIRAANPPGPALAGYVGGSTARFSGQTFVSPADGTLIVLLESGQSQVQLVALQPGP